MYRGKVKVKEGFEVYFQGKKYIAGEIIEDFTSEKELARDYLEIIEETSEVKEIEEKEVEGKIEKKSGKKSISKVSK